MSNLRDYFQYKSSYIVSADIAKSRSYFFESVDLNQDGNKDVIFFGFTFPNNGVLSAVPQPSMLYWGTDSGGYTLASAISISLPATTHPREIAYADFNEDGKLDIFLADHGWDTNPFPGGQNQLILSSPNVWTIETSNIPTRMDFTHCTAVGDINNDGNVDIFLGNVDTAGTPVKASILFGDGTGKFTESTTAVPSEIRGPIRFYAAQLADLNKDGWVDLIIGNSGDTNNSKPQSIVYWNNLGSYSNTNSTQLSNGYFGAKNEQILDIQSADINGDGTKDLVLLSTQNNPSYKGWSLQVLSNQGNSFADITSESFGSHIFHMGNPGDASGMPWIAFFKLADANGDGSLDIIFDSIKSYGYSHPEEVPLIYLNDGFSHYAPIFADDILDLNSTYKEFFSDASPFVSANGVSWLNQFIWQDSVFFRELLPTKPLPKISSITATAAADQVTGNELDNFLFGLAGNDVLVDDIGNDCIDGGSGNDAIDGGVGVDTTVYNANRTTYTITKTSTGFYVSGGADGTDTLTNIERIKFADKGVALDLNGNAGTTAKILGAVFGKDTVSNESYVGIGLHFLDNLHYSYTNLMQMAINARLGTDPTNAQVVDLLYTNVVGKAPDEATQQSFVELLDNGTYTISSLGVLAADTDLNKTNINLVGLMQTGLEYMPFG